MLSPASTLRPTLTDLICVAGHFTRNTAHTLATAAREHILAVLEQTNWTVGGREGAAVRLGLPRTTLLYKMRRLGIEPRRTQRCRFMPAINADNASPIESAMSA